MSALDSRQVDIHTAMPAKVEAYNASKQTVDVQPMLDRALPDGQDNYSTEPLPKLSSVPVCFPRGGGFMVTLPISAGDYVLLVFSERSIGNWRSTGNRGDPGDLGMHTLDGAVAIPGVFPSNDSLSNASDTNMVIGKDGTSASQVVLDGSKVLLGGGAQFVALANKVLDALGDIKSAYDLHKHTGVTTGGGSTGTPDLTWLNSSVAASNVKAT
jgi:hypothetical protein